jgi:hypothetical protein
LPKIGNTNLLDDIFLGSVNVLFKTGFKFRGVNFYPDISVYNLSDFLMNFWLFAPITCSKLLTLRLFSEN